MNGQLNPWYNIQLATENQFALAYTIYANPTDTRTLIPFVQAFDASIVLPKYLIADAGYASEENYCFMLDETATIPIIPYQGYLKKETVT